MVLIDSGPLDVLAVILIIMALLGVAIAILHHRATRSLHLTSEPSTLASAVALAGQSDLGRILDGKDTKEEMHAILADLNFALDPVRGRSSL